MLSIIQVESKHLKDVAPLFDSYRVFYKQPPDLKAASSFLEDRFSKKESLIFLAYLGNTPVGFTQLYYTFSSVSLKPSLILNDLYVHKEFRKQKVGEARPYWRKQNPIAGKTDLKAWYWKRR